MQGIATAPSQFNMNRKARRAVASLASKSVQAPKILLQPSGCFVFDCDSGQPYAKLQANVASQVSVAAAAPVPTIELGTVAHWQKDILRPGTWHTSDGQKSFSADQLTGIVASFRLAKSRGIQIPVILARPGADDQHEEIAGHQVGAIEDVWSGPNGELMAKLWTASANDAAVYQLDLQKQNTSPEIWRNWKDGHGNVYPIFLKHLAIVTHPVVHPQGNFVRLSLSNRRIKMAADTKDKGKGADAGGDVVVQFTGTSTVAEVFESLKTSLTDLGLLVPDDITADNLIGSLQLMASLKRAADQQGDQAAQGDTDTAEGMAKDATASYAAQPAATMALISAKDKRIKELEDAANLQSQNIFRAALTSHVKRGAITQAKANDLAKSGERMSFALDFLAPLEVIPDGTAFPVGQTRIAKMATGKPPEVNAGNESDGDKKTISDERAKEISKNFTSFR